jgi:DNA-binding XRE family transcriptional regulator
MDTIKLARIKAGLSVQEAANKLNISEDFLYKIEEGKRKPSALLKLSMTKVYNCNIKDLS